MNFNILAGRALNALGLRRVMQKSYSQMGEDLIIAYHLKTRGFSPGKIKYIDIGAFAPKTLSNTYYFYKHGAFGVLIEPDIDLIKPLKSARKRDIVLNIGISKEEKFDADFYVINPPTLNSFSKEMADFVNSDAGRKAYGNDIGVKEVRKVNLVNINTVIKDHFNGRAPELLSIDAEGLDWDILSSLDFDLYSPYTICIEINQNYEKVLQLLLLKKYCLVGYNQLNAIFMKQVV